MHVTDEMVEALRRQLIALGSGGCSCGVKSPQAHWHEPTCPYRIVAEALDNLDALEAALRAAPAAELVADGWVMVPREPTPEMLDAFIDVALKPRDFSYGLEVSDPRAGYRAMLAAAPTEAGR